MTESRYIFITQPQKTRTDIHGTSEARLKLAPAHLHTVLFVSRSSIWCWKRASRVCATRFTQDGIVDRLWVCHAAPVEQKPSCLFQLETDFSRATNVVFTRSQATVRAKVIHPCWDCNIRSSCQLMPQVRAMRERCTSQQKPLRPWYILPLTLR